MKKFKVFLAILFVVSFASLLFENAGIRNQLELEKERSKTLETFGTKTFETLNHTLSFLETTEHAKDNYKMKMNEYRAELERCYENKPEFLWIAEDIANANGWIANEYDCTEFSKDLVKELKNNGYKARVVNGYNYYINGTTCDGEDLEIFNCRHDWVCLGEEYDYGVCIEAVRGTIIPHSLYGNEYTFREEGEWK